MAPQNQQGQILVELLVIVVIFKLLFHFVIFEDLSRIAAREISRTRFPKLEARN
jgi:hypothetical protein